MMKLSLLEIKAEIDQHASKIGATGEILPTYGHAEDGARPHVEVDSYGYHYVIVERGQEFSRLTTDCLDDLLYQVFSDVSFNLACEYELAHRVDSEDFRRILFKRQVELLSTLSSQWVQRQIKEHELILQKHPYDDWSNARVILSTKIGWEKACDEYPLP